MKVFNNNIRYNIRITSRTLLSPEAYFYVTSQTGKYNPKHTPELRSRMKDLFEGIFVHTFEPVLQSNELTQDFKNQLFHHERVQDFLMDLIAFNRENTTEEEQNKLYIVRDMLQLSLAYLQQRYKEVTFVKDKINELKQLIEGLTQLADQQAEEEQAIKFYKLRGSMKLPPDIRQLPNIVTAMCRICWEYYSAPINERKISIVKNESLKGIRHRKHCLYDKNQMDRCIEFGFIQK